MKIDLFFNLNLVLTTFCTAIFLRSFNISRENYSIVFAACFYNFEISRTTFVFSHSPRMVLEKLKFLSHMDNPVYYVYLLIYTFSIHESMLKHVDSILTWSLISSSNFFCWKLRHNGFTLVSNSWFL